MLKYCASFSVSCSGVDEVSILLGYDIVTVFGSWCFNTA